jgi:hypothetical protein
MAFARPTTGYTISSTSSTAEAPAPTQHTPDSDADDSDGESVPALRGGGDTGELRKIRNSSEKQSYRGSRDQEESSSEDDSEKDHIKPVRRIGSRSKEYTDEEEKAIVRKLDLRLTLFIALLYMLSFLDRSSKKSPIMALVGQTVLIVSSSQTLAMRVSRGWTNHCRSVRRSTRGFSRPSTLPTSCLSG